MPSPSAETGQHKVSVMASFRTVEWALLEPAQTAVQVGDLLSVEPGGMPIFRVLDVSDGLISLKDERHPPLQTRSLDAFRWRAARA